MQLPNVCIYEYDLAAFVCIYAACMYVHMCIHVHVCVCMCVYVHLEGQTSISGIFLSDTHYF